MISIWIMRWLRSTSLSTKILPFIPVWWDIFWQTRRSSYARTSRRVSPRLRSFTLSIGGLQTDGPARTGDTNASGGWLGRILTPETQSAELRPMSNNSPDRGYATPTTDLFTYRWPQHLRVLLEGWGRGGGSASPGLDTVPASVWEGNHRLGHQGTNAVLWYCLWHFFCWLSERLNSRGSYSSHRNVTLSTNSSCNMTFMRFTVVAWWALMH